MVCKMRKIKKHNRSVMSQTVEVRETGAPLSSLGRTSSYNVVIKRTCGKHWALLTLQGANKDERFLGCHYCEPDENRIAKQRASYYAIKAAETIPGCFPDEAKVIIEARVLEGFNGGMDFTVEYKHQNMTKVLDIEVDGQQHFEGQYHQTTAEEQREIDKKKDRMALEQKRHLLRLHYNDLSFWRREIEHARHVIETKSYRRNVFYSYSYKKKNISRR